MWSSDLCHGVAATGLRLGRCEVGGQKSSHGVAAAGLHLGLCGVGGQKSSHGVAAAGLHLSRRGAAGQGNLEAEHTGGPRGRREILGRRLWAAGLGSPGTEAHEAPPVAFCVEPVGPSAAAGAGYAGREANGAGAAPPVASSGVTVAQRVGNAIAKHH